jgi:formate hydrogenlyase transcriptional activator
VLKAGFVIKESVHRRKDGTTFPIEVNLKRVQLDKEYVVAISRDITERKRAATLLEESEKRFRAVYDRAPVGIGIVDSRTGRFLQINPKYCEIVGRTRQQMLALCFRDITHPDDRDASVARAMQLRDQRVRDYDFEKRYVRPDGRVVWVNLSVVPMWEQGEPARWHMAIVQDITERKRSEQALRESEERLRLSQEVAKIGTFDQNLLTGESSWTPPLQAMHGLRPNELPRSVEDFLKLIHPDDRAHVAGLVDQSFESGDGRGEWRARWRDGTVRWISSKWRVFKDANGKPVRVIGSDYDITDRKQIEEELRAAKEKLTEEKLYLEQEINTEFGFDNIVGQSKALKAVMGSVAKVAASDATVLLLGETGTGKELVARAIHRMSRRNGKAFIKMNCAAIPSGLLESELFGHEKGAFTGAVTKKIGRLELADQGTIFLDEIGEISLALQPKLLRVLQDQEFERLGGTQTLKINFRLIAATNCDLAKSVREKEFRSDLYYRLNVFPIFLPPLRERREDVPLLVEHFVQKIARRMNKSITTIPKKTMDALIGWSWPGNVRELENFLERSLILTTGSVLTAPLSELHLAAVPQDKEETLEAAERRHIVKALRETRGQISGPRGAAIRLGLKRTTLQSKLKQLGINPRVPS